MNSDEDLSDSEASQYSSDDDGERREDVKVDLPRDGRNVGRLLRNDLNDDDEDDEGDEDEDEQQQKKKRTRVARKMDEVFDAKFQLPLGKRQRAHDADLEQDIDAEMDEWLANQSLDSGEDDEDEEANEAHQQNKMLRSAAPAAVNPKHVRNQRKTEAELVGLRIHMQPLIDMSRKLMTNEQDASSSSSSSLATVKPLRTLLWSLLEVRQLMYSNGPAAVAPPSTARQSSLKISPADLLWDAIEQTETRLWQHHVGVIEAAERRTQLTSQQQRKQLKAMNRTALEQTEQALARRQEINTSASSSFFTEDQDFYNQLLRDFVSMRSSTSAAASTGKRGGGGGGGEEGVKTRRSQKEYHQAKKEEAKMNFAVHDKLVNFIAPVLLPQPTLDIDQFTKSLFQ